MKESEYLSPTPERPTCLFRSSTFASERWRVSLPQVFVHGAASLCNPREQCAAKEVVLQCLFAVLLQDVARFI